MRDDQWRDLEQREERSARLRDRFGLADKGANRRTGCWGRDRS